MQEISLETLMHELNDLKNNLMHIREADVVRGSNEVLYDTQTGYLRRVFLRPAAIGKCLVFNLDSPLGASINTSTVMTPYKKIWREESDSEVRFKICEKRPENDCFVELRVSLGDSKRKEVSFEKFGEEMEKFLHETVFVKEVEKGKVDSETYGKLRKFDMKPDVFEEGQKPHHWLLFLIEQTRRTKTSLRLIAGIDMRVWRKEESGQILFRISDTPDNIDNYIEIWTAQDGHQSEWWRNKEKQERLKFLFDGLFNILGITYNDFNHKILLNEDQSSGIEDLEEEFSELVLSRKVGTGLYQVSTISLLSTVSRVLCGKRLVFKVDDKTHKIVGVSFLDDKDDEE